MTFLIAFSKPGKTIHMMTPEEISAIRNTAGNNSRVTADYINVNNSQNPEEQVTLYEAPTGASAQYAKVNKIQIQQYAQVDKSKKNNAPLYAHVNRILNRDSHNYEPLSQPNKSHYADIETTNTNKPPKMEKMEPNYIEVGIRDDPDDESPPK